MGLSSLDLKHCPLCGRLFVKTHRSVCDACAIEEDKQIQNVVTWLRRNPNSSLQQVVEATGAEERLVLQLIRDDRIVVVSAMVPCERCGTLIHSGKFCAACRREMAQALLEDNPVLYKELTIAQGRFHIQRYKQTQQQA